jgi:hypothetical protein
MKFAGQWPTKFIALPPSYDAIGKTDDFHAAADGFVHGNDVL